MSEPEASQEPFLTTRTVTFLFTDIEGSTRLWEQHPDAMRCALARHDALLRRLIEDHDGRVFKTVGDAFCAAFPDAQGAVSAALETQRAIRAADWDDVGALRVRVALHTGSAEQRDGDFFGPSLSRVARLLAAAHGGQTLLSSATEERIRDGLPDGTRLRDLGIHRLRYLAKPEQIYQVVDPEAPGDFPPLRAVAAFAHNLPLQLTSFVGREREMAEVRRLLGETRLLTLTGPGGCGKTRLAVQTGEEMTGEYPDGVWLVEMASLTDGGLVPGAIAAALGLREERERPLVETVIESLRVKHLLLVLDNCEHLVDACAELADRLLRACPHLRLLVTSREPLGVPGETNRPVPPLGVPPDRGRSTTPATDVGTLTRYESVRLFVERASAAQPGFALSEVNAPAVAQVCRRLDGIPLALELAAARVRAMPPQQMATRLDDCFRILTGGARTAPTRQQTLRAAIDWSHALLPERERTLLRRLAVFAGTFTLEAAEAVVSDSAVVSGQWSVVSVGAPEPIQSAIGNPQSAIEEWEVFDLLSRLVDKSLVMVGAGPEGEARYRLLDTIRQYSLGRLRESGELEALEARHCEFYVLYAEAAERELLGPEQVLWLNRLEEDHDNLRAALHWSRTLAGSHGLRLTADLWRFWYVRGHLSEGLRWVRDMLFRSRTADRLLYARALTGAGSLAWAGGNLSLAMEFHEQALGMRRAGNDERGVASSLNNLGLVAHHRRDLVLAGHYLQESLALYRRLGDEKHVGITLLNLGGIASEQGHLDAASRLLEESLEILTRIGDEGCVSRVCNNLGVVARLRGHLDEARRLLRHSLRLKYALQDREGCASSLDCLGMLAAQELSGEQAARLMGAAEAVKEAIGACGTPSGYASAVTALRRLMGDGAFHEAWAQGKSLDLESALNLALEGEPQQLA